MKALVVSLGRMSIEKTLPREVAAREALIAGRGEAVIFLVEHEPVYTVGRAGVRREFPAAVNGVPADPRRRPNVLGTPPHPVVELDRGGDVTWHGPGQLVVYPVIPLKPLGLSFVGYIRALERSAIAALAGLGVEAHAREGLTGVWVRHGGREAKLGAIGIGCRRWVTYHGMSLNVTCDLTAFDAIRPCGIEGVRVTSLAEVMAGTPPPFGALRTAALSLSKGPPGLDELGRAVAEALGHEIGVSLEQDGVAAPVGGKAGNG